MFSYEHSTGVFNHLSFVCLWLSTFVHYQVSDVFISKSVNTELESFPNTNPIKLWFKENDGKPTRTRSKLSQKKKKVNCLFKIGRRNKQVILRTGSLIDPNSCWDPKTCWSQKLVAAMSENNVDKHMFLKDSFFYFSFVTANLHKSCKNSTKNILSPIWIKMITWHHHSNISLCVFQPYPLTTIVRPPKLDQGCSPWSNPHDSFKFCQQS